MNDNAEGDIAKNSVPTLFDGDILVSCMNDRKQIKDLLNPSVEEIQELNADGNNIFFVVNEVCGESREDSDVIRLRALFIDCDGGHALPDISEFMAPPSLLCRRDNDETRWHAFWLLDGTDEISRFKGAQKALAQAYSDRFEKASIDSTVTNPARLMRMPDTLNYKESANCGHIEIYSNSDNIYTIDKLMELHKTQEVISNKESIKGTYEETMTPDDVAMERVCFLGQDSPGEGNRYMSIIGWIHSMVPAGMPQADILSISQEQADNWGASYSSSSWENALSSSIEKYVNGELEVSREALNVFRGDPISLIREKGKLALREIGTRILEYDDYTLDDIKDAVGRDGMNSAKFKTHIERQKKEKKEQILKEHMKIHRKCTFDAGDYEAMADAFLSQSDKIVFAQNVFFIYDGTRYKRLDDKYLELKRALDEFLEASYIIGHEGPTPFHTNEKIRMEVISKIQIKCAVLGDHTDNLNFWLNDRKSRPIAFKNGLLFGDELCEHDDNWFSETCLNFDYDPDATCPLWIKCLNDWFEDDEDRKLLLQQWMGYLISGRTDVQKIFYMWGAPGGGKGTVSSLIEELLGEKNISNPSMKELTDDFGLAPAIGKSVILLSDAHVVEKGGSRRAVDVLKRISGDDRIQVNRKRIGQVQVKLGNVVMASNELVQLSDASGGIKRRMSILSIDKSFVGREDPELKKKLKAELAGICNWALEGYEKFVEHGAFVKPKMGIEDLEELDESSNTIKGFLAEYCTLTEDPEDFISTKELFKKFTSYCDSGRIGGISIKAFGIAMRSICTRKGCKVQRIDGKPEKVYRGIKYQSHAVTVAPKMPA